MRLRETMTTLLSVVMLLGILPLPALGQTNAAPRIVVAVPDETGDRLASRVQTALDQGVDGAVVVRYTGPVTSPEAAKRIGLYFNAAVIVWQDATMPDTLQVTSEMAGMPVSLQTGQLPVGSLRADAAATRTIAGQALSRMGNCEAALPQLNRAETLASPGWPGLIEVFYARGLCYTFVGDTPAALDNFTAALEIGEAPWYVHYVAAQLYATTNDLEAATNAITQALTLLPENPTLLTDRAMFYTQMGNHTAALADYDRALLASPDNPNLLLLRAQTFTMMGDYDAALLDLDAALNTDAANEEVLRFQHGLVQLYRGDFAAAVSDLRQYTTFRPEDPAGWINLGQAHENQGELFSAIQAYETALLHDPAATHLYTALSRLYYDAVASFEPGSTQAADYLTLSINAATAATDANPLDTTALLYRALAHMARNANEPALEDLSRAIDLAPDFAAAHYNRAVVYTRLGHAALDSTERAGLFRAALNDYGALFQIDFAAYNYLLPYAGYLHVDLAEYDAALEHFAAYDELYPNQPLDAVGAVYRGRTFRALGQTDAALNAYAPALNAPEAAYACEAQLASGIMLASEPEHRDTAARYLQQYLTTGCAPNPITASALAVTASGLSSAGAAQ